MVAIRWSCSPVHLDLSQPLVTAKGPISRRALWLLRADDGQHQGLGEASPLPGFGGEDPQHCRAMLQDLPSNPRAALDYAAELLAHSPCAAAAIRGALADLTARRRGLPLARQLALGIGAKASAQLRCNALLHQPDSQRAQALHQAGFRAFKWKSCGDVDADAAAVLALRQALGPGVKLRLDANGTWTLEQAQHFARLVAEADLDYVEQPLPVGAEDQLQALTPLKLRVALDESITSLADLRTLLDRCWAEVLVLKPQWLGGFPALRQACIMARERHPRRVVVSSTMDSAVGRAHALHAAAALGLESESHGLATGSLMQQDLGPEEISNGRWLLGSAAGIGLTVDLP